MLQETREEMEGVNNTHVWVFPVEVINNYGTEVGIVFSKFGGLFITKHSGNMKKAVKYNPLVPIPPIFSSLQ